MATHTVTTTAAQLIYNPVSQSGPVAVTIEAVSGGVHYVGQSGVTTSTGVPMNAGDKLILRSPVVAIYATNAASGTLDVTATRV